jgi:F0F1-type ATP synthase assembly protein I
MAVGVFTLLIFFVLGIVFALLTGWLADRKGYSFPLFAFLGFFLGPVAAIIAAVMPSKKLAPAET